LLVTVNNRLKVEIVHDLSCHPIVMCALSIVHCVMNGLLSLFDAECSVVYFRGKTSGVHLLECIL